MTPRTHPSQTLLANFATGQLPAAASVTVSAHLDACQTCRRHASAFEEAEGRLLDETSPVAMSPGALERLLAGLDEPRPLPGTAPAHLGDVLLPTAAARVGFGARRWLAPGLWAAPLHAAPVDNWRCFLLRTPPGTVIPTHGHGGGELIAVLTGAFHDGQSFSAGDFAENIAGHDHRLEVASDAPCACLISVQGRIQWRAWARLITPVLGI